MTDKDLIHSMLMRLDEKIDKISDNMSTLATQDELHSVRDDVNAFKTTVKAVGGTALAVIAIIKGVPGEIYDVVRDWGNQS